MIKWHKITNDKWTTRRYLCDFVYYYSLYHGQGKAALIHVPASGCLASPERLVPQLQTIIYTLLRQLDSSAHTTSEYQDSTQVENILHKTFNKWHLTQAFRLIYFFNSKFKKKRKYMKILQIYIKPMACKKSTISTGGEEKTEKQEALDT